MVGGGLAPHSGSDAALKITVDATSGMKLGFADPFGRGRRFLRS